jgi:hypothetical protein
MRKRFDAIVTGTSDRVSPDIRAVWREWETEG